ncbi:S1C family serine protease [Schinkia sp. CFF1]
MNSKVLSSVLITILIWISGVGGYFVLTKEVRNDLDVKPFVSAQVDKKKEPKELKEIIREAQKSVVMIVVEQAGAIGSGFLYNEKGDIITNAHVVAGAKNVKVRMADTREYDGKVIGISSDTDVALVRVSALAGEKPLSITKENGEIGDEVLALGSPLGLQNTVTEGIISGTDRSFEIEPFSYHNVYQISAPIAPGNSGGPLINKTSGEVLGINAAGTNEGTIGFSIPFTNIIGLVDGWSESPMEELPNVDSFTAEMNDQEEFSLEDSARYLVQYFYDSINYQDFVTAYSLLGSSWQSKMSYHSFRDGYLKTNSVEIQDLQTSKNGENIKVTAIIKAEERKNGETVYSTYKTTYDAGYENNIIKLLSGKGQKIN